MRPSIFFLTIILMLTACTAPAAPTLDQVGISEPKSDVTKLEGTLETSLLVSEWRGSTEGNLLFPLDPAGGTALSTYPPISLGYTFFYAMSPDQQTLAVVSYPGESTYNGSLLLIDLPAWETEHLELKLSGWVSSMGFSPDGNQLAIAHGESSHKLTLVNIEKELITAQSQITSYAPRLNFTHDGRALMLYHETVNPADMLTAGPPQVLLLDATDLTPLWSAELKEVRNGVFPKSEDVNVTNIHEPGQAFYISPGLAFAPDRDRLYIVHADSEQLTTVDFGSRSFGTVEIQTKLTWFERLLSMTAGVAHAKIGDGITRQAAISPDGQYLYVIGVNSSTSQDQYGNWQMEQSSSGLDILQTQDGSRVQHIETDTTELSLSPDGRYIYLRNWGNNQDNIPSTEIFDTKTRQRITRETGISGTPASLMNGEFLLVSTYSTSEASHHMSVLTPDGSSMLSEWTHTKYVWWMTTP